MFVSFKKDIPRVASYSISWVNVSVVLFSLKASENVCS